MDRDPKLFEGRNQGPDDTPPWGLETEVTLRDLFAAAVVTGLTADPGTFNPADPKGYTPKLAKLAYKIADAMLAERIA